MTMHGEIPGSRIRRAPECRRRTPRPRRNRRSTECNRQAGHRSIQARYRNISPRACLMRRSRRRSTRNSTPPIPATPQSAAPGDWGFSLPPVPGTRPGWRRKPPPSSTRKMRERYASLSGWIMPVFEREETVKLRCVETDPRHLTLLELEPGDCRFPYGGDQEGEAITFCGQPCCEHSSYCAPHFHLTRGPGSPLKRPASTVALRLVEAA